MKHVSHNESCSESAQIYLASGSPRRKELFDRFWGDLGYQVCIPEFDEQIAIRSIQDAPPVELAKRLTRGKIVSIKSKLDLSETFIALAADTIVVIEDQIMGKPADKDEAAAMLRKLSGRRHQVITAVAIMACNQNKEELMIATETTDVDFDELDDKLINWYISTGEPMDKAGAYGIQGHGSALIKKIDGCYYNVMGLPVNRMMNMLRSVALSSPDFKFISDLLPWS